MAPQIAHNIRRLRELKHFSQDYLAHKLNISIRAYSKIENGESKLSIGRFLEIAKVLEVAPEIILYFDENFLVNNVLGNSEGKRPLTTIELQTTYDRYIQHLEKEISYLRSEIQARK